MSRVCVSQPVLFSAKIAYGFGLTVTSNDALVVLPVASEVTQVTVVLPKGKTVADGGVQVTPTGPSTRSVAVAVHETGVPAAVVASTVVLPGTPDNSGPVVSTT